MFAVVRHPDVDVAGICPASVYELHRAAGWYRVSEWAPTSEQFHLPGFAPDLPDLDAVEVPTEPTTPAAKSKKEKAA